MAGPSRACVHRNSIYLVYIHYLHLFFQHVSIRFFSVGIKKRSDLPGLVFQIVFYIFIGEFLAANSRSKVSQFEHLSSTSKVTSRMQQRGDENQELWLELHQNLEPVCPLFLDFNPPKQGRNSNKNKGPHLGSRKFQRWNPEIGEITCEWVRSLHANIARHVAFVFRMVEKLKCEM